MSEQVKLPEGTVMPKGLMGKSFTVTKLLTFLDSVKKKHTHLGKEKANLFLLLP